MGENASLGITLSLVTALLLGFFMVPRRYFKADTATFMVGLTFGAAVGNIIYWLFSGGDFALRPLAILPFLAGINWSAGTFAYAAGTHRVGIAKATGIKNTQLVWTTFGGFILFGEAATTSIPWAFAGAALILLTAIVLANIQHNEESIPRATLKGYMLPVISSVLYGANGLTIKFLGTKGLAVPQTCMSIGIGAFVGGLCFYAINNKKLNFLSRAPLSQHLLSVIGGIIWAAALVTMTLSIKYVGVAVAWALLNLSIVVTVLYGTFFLKELDIRKRWGSITVGLVLGCLGLLCLYLSKTLLQSGV